MNFKYYEKEVNANADPDFIKWLDFSVSYEALEDTMSIDIDAFNQGKAVNWIDILALLGSKYGGDFSKYKKEDAIHFKTQLLQVQDMREITSSFKQYDYYKEAYQAVLAQFIGSYKVEVPSDENSQDKVYEEHYGLKVFSPIAKTFPFEHYDDFGASRSYGFSRPHLGHDMMAAIGTPVIAVESGVVEALGWNQYGGWRIGIRSFDTKRYYYYAHLRQDRPYHVDLFEGKTVKAGDVIGYVGRTGYSTQENVNNIEISHLHWGMQIIFDESQKDSNNEIWIDLYPLTKLLEKNKSETTRVPDTKEFYRKFDFIDLNNNDTLID